MVNIESETISRLAEIEGVRAVKQANGDLDQARHIVETGLDLYAGDDKLLQQFLELGGVGGICVHTHVVGPQVAEQVAAAWRVTSSARGGSTRRSRLPTSCCGCRRTRSRSRRRCDLLGHQVGGHRLPLVEATEAEVAAVRGCLERLGLLVHASQA